MKKAPEKKAITVDKKKEAEMQVLKATEAALAAHESSDKMDNKLKMNKET